MLKGDRTLKKEQVSKVQIERDWERVRNNRIAQKQAKALAKMEEKIAKAIQSTQNRKELEEILTKNFQEAKAEFISNIAEIRKGI